MKKIKCLIVHSLLCYIAVLSQTSNDLNYEPLKFPRSELDKGDHNFSSTQSSNTQMKNSAHEFAQRIIELRDMELGTKIVKELVNSLEFKTSESNEEEKIKQISGRLKSKLSGYLAVLNHSVTLIEDFKHHSKKLCFVNVPCVYISENGSYEEPLSNTSFDFSNLPLSILNLTEVFTSYPEPNINKHVHYFISELEQERLTHVYSDDFNGDKCMLLDDPHFQRVFLKTVSKEAKQLVLLIDNGVSLSESQFTIAKSLANHIVSSLCDEDRISIFAVSDTVVSGLPSQSLECAGAAMAYATDTTKHLFTTFVQELNKSKGLTNHSLGFAMAFKAIEESMKNESVPALIIYISRGLMSSITEAKTAMEIISDGQDRVSGSVVINTCMLVDENKSILYENYLLSGFAEQNFSMYDIVNRKSEAGLITKGSMVSINSTSNTGAVVRSLTSTSLLKLNTKPTFFLPRWDIHKKRDLVISIAQVAKDKEENLLGVVGIDIPLEELAEDFLYSNLRLSSYAFLVTIDGKALAHPRLREPTAALYEQPVALDISNFETSSVFPKVRSVIFQNSSGVWKVNKAKRMYSWMHVFESPYIVIGASTSTSRSVVWPSPSPIASASAHLAYHRLDLAHPGQYTLCSNLRQLASLDTGSLFLSSGCFQSPYEYLSSEKNVSQINVQSYMAYLKDATKLLANPGLCPGIRSEVISVADIIPYWKKLYVDSALTKYIVRKYIVTASGAVIMYPGGVLDHRLDVLHRHWYLRAVHHQGLTTVSPPYLDSAGAGYVVTLSVAFGEDPQMFVLSMDFTLGAMFQLMVEWLPSCSSPLESVPGNVKCFLMDDRGYLIAHPSLIDPLSKGAADEQHHITHRESLLANDLLNHKGLVKKLVCNDFASNTVQRFYQFNMSLDHVVTNMISGEQCIRYQLTRLPRTNIFLGVVNTTCDLVTAFCPCNTVDRHCLNCNRMEQNECECPCECPLDVNVCEKPVTQFSNEPCPRVSEPGLHMSQSVRDMLLTVNTCFQPLCEHLVTHKLCLGVVGCEWCQLQADGISVLPTPFCTHQSYCYNSVTGHSGDNPTRPNVGIISGSGVPLGSISGAVMALLAALSLMVYCYCKHSVRRNLNYMSANHNTSFHMLTMDKSLHNNIHEEPPAGANTGLVSNAQELSVALLSPASTVSPYRMSCGYRRPPTGDSDHGYSTMTPHEDTEPPLSTTPTPSLSNTPPSHQTLLPNHIIAPVTVHMPMYT